MENHDATKITEEQLVTAEELGRLYGISPKTVRKWGASGFFPVVRLSKKCVRYPLASCNEIVRKRRVKATSEI